MNRQGAGFYAPLVMIFLLCGGQARAAPVRIAYSIIGPPVAAVWMAQETGAFKKYGFDASSLHSFERHQRQALWEGGRRRGARSSGVVLGARARSSRSVRLHRTAPMTLYVSRRSRRSNSGQILGITR
jgi:ABC-type nitrate/sulfonate/bicarbonate transport system substrate-binding protein